MSHRKLNRREFLRLSAVAASGAVLAGCAEKAAPTPAAEATPEPEMATVAPEEVVEEVSIEIWQAQGSIDSMAKTDEAFASRYPNIKLNYVPTPLEETSQRLLAVIAAGSGAPDLAFVMYADMVNFTSRGGAGLTDLSAFIEPRKDEWMGWAIDLVTTPDGKIVAFPADVGAMVFFYRRDAFDGAGLDSDPEAVKTQLATWDDFIAVGEQFRASGERWLIANSWWVFDILRQQGGQAYFDDNGQPIVNNETFVEAARSAQQVREADIDAQIDTWSADWNATMSEGSIGVYPSAAWFDGVWYANAPDTKGKWGLAPLPGGASANYGGSYYVLLDQSQKKDAAWTYLTFALATEEGLRPTIYPGNMYLPAWLPALEFEDFTAPNEFYAGQPFGQIFLEIWDQVPVIHTDVNDGVAYEAVYQAVLDITKDGADPQDRLDQANEEIKQRIAG